MSHSTYRDMLDEYFYGPPDYPRYWQKFKTRMWRLCGSKAYKGQRDMVYLRRRFYWRKRRERMMRELITRPNPFLDRMPKEDCFRGSHLPVPIRFGGCIVGISS